MGNYWLGIPGRVSVCLQVNIITNRDSNIFLSLTKNLDVDAIFSRLILTNEILTTFSETYGNGYMKLQFVGVIDEFYGYSIGLILFAATIKFLKLCLLYTSPSPRD